MRARWQELLQSPTARAQALRLGLVLAFVLAVSRFWSPYFGFTAFLQADVVTAKNLPASLRDAPIFIHEKAGRYDGAYYAQIATDPLLRDPDLTVAVDAPGYRARRILLSVLAWVAGGGEPVAAVHAYAWLNLGCWLLLAWLLAMILPAGVGGARRRPGAGCCLLVAHSAACGWRSLISQRCCCSPAGCWAWNAAARDWPRPVWVWPDWREKPLCWAR